jgi:anthranilate 1,2-dioxygenase ferredoxin reductase subunit
VRWLGVDPKAEVHCLRTLDDARAIRSKLLGSASVAVIGGGPIGLELAVPARQLGAKATVIEVAPRLRLRSAPATIAAALLVHHQSCGVEVVLNAGAKAVHPGWVELTGALRIEADLVVIGISVVANDDLAHDAGIAIDDGIYIDGRFRTTQTDVDAIGDVTRQSKTNSGRFERIETWSNALG